MFYDTYNELTKENVSFPFQPLLSIYFSYLYTDICICIIYIRKNNALIQGNLKDFSFNIVKENCDIFNLPRFSMIKLATFITHTQIYIMFFTGIMCYIIGLSQSPVILVLTYAIFKWCLLFQN